MKYSTIAMALLAAALLSCSSKAESRSILPENSEQAQSEAAAPDQTNDDANDAATPSAENAAQAANKPASRPAGPASVKEFTKYYDGKFDKKKSFIVISKLNQTLSVYADIQGDTTLVARYPVCLSKNKGNKQKVGDMKTPESTMAKPFSITQIQDASSWHHDFGDGRGNIRAYGNWFLRLLTPGHSGIGIHGSTNNESSVPGRASEGCIRLRDADIDNLKANYAYVGMPVIIHAEEEPNYPFEQ